MFDSIYLQNNRITDLNASISSQSTQSSNEHQATYLLDQMDYYRASMTRQEAEKVTSYVIFVEQFHKNFRFLNKNVSGRFLLNHCRSAKAILVIIESD